MIWKDSVGIAEGTVARLIGEARRLTASGAGNSENFVDAKAHERAKLAL